VPEALSKRWVCLVLRHGSTIRPAGFNGLAGRLQRPMLSVPADFDVCSLRGATGAHHRRRRHAERGLGVAVLGAADVAGYLLDRKLLSPRAVVDGELRIEDASRLNRVFVVTAEGERCYVLKLAGEAGEAGVAREAAVLERLHSLDPGGSLASLLPVVVAYDTDQGMLILESAADARDLRRHHARGRFSCVLAREAGRALALLHAVPPGALDGLPHAPHPTGRTQLHRPDLDTMFTLSEAAVELTRIIQGSDELCAELDELCTGWSEESVTHGDIRWDNCLALRGRDSSRWTRLQLIDWERCGLGDPGFDIGAFFGEYLRAWLQSVPIADHRDPGRLLGHARLPLRRMRPALRAFWASYTLHRGTSPAESRATLRRSTRFAALRLITAALEEAQSFAELRARALYQLTLSENILRRPHEAMDMFGLGASWRAA
jgi:aminoglycoside phosphotransferase (APT) family kinase protein